jgi:hypothetical protein
MPAAFKWQEETVTTETWSEFVLRCHRRTAPGARKPLASPMQPPECEVCDSESLLKCCYFGRRLRMWKPPIWLQLARHSLENKVSTRQACSWKAFRGWTSNVFHVRMLKLQWLDAPEIHLHYRSLADVRFVTSFRPQVLTNGFYN